MNPRMGLDQIEGVGVIESQFRSQTGHGIAILETASSQAVFHRIKDEELDIMMLSDYSVMQNVAAVLFGAGIGFLQNLFAVLNWIGHQSEATIKAWDVVGALLCMLLLGVGAALFLASIKGRTPAQALGARIKARSLSPID